MIVPPMTSSQLRAATSNDRLCYVKAGPGSGKTFTAAEAFGYLRHVRHRDDRRGICGATFARSARRELASRIRLRWGPESIGWPNAICTFDEIHRRLMRYLVHKGLVDWPGGRVPDRPEDSWTSHPDASSKPGKRPRFRVGLDADGRLAVIEASNNNQAPTPAFTDPRLLTEALSAGRCTHNDIRNALADAIDQGRHPTLNDAVRECLAGSFCHLIVDEAFDMNPLDVAVVERAMQVLSDRLDDRVSVVLREHLAA
ncbi:MAG: UvrD-helicase domain-containing protein [Pseudonocardiaceae bacterium]